MEVLRVKVFKSDRIGIRIRGPGRVRIRVRVAGNLHFHKRIRRL